MSARPPRDDALASKKPPDDSQTIGQKIEIYKLLVEMADRVSQRRQTANSFYLSVNTLLVGGSAYLGDKQTSVESALVAVAGISICSLWLMNGTSYKTLNAAKFDVIQEVEKELPLQAFTNEWAKLDPNRDGKKHRQFHEVERVVPWIFMGVYVAQFLRKLPWGKIAQALSFC